jgi:integrase
MEEFIENVQKTKKGPTKYWRVIKGQLYARFQYKDDAGNRREKLRPISDKRTARGVVEAMRKELEEYGDEALKNDRMTFEEFAPMFKETKLKPPVFANKVKVSGRKSNVNWAYDVLVRHFGSRPLRSIRPLDLERYKDHRLKDITRKGTLRNIATVNRELSLLRSMLNYACQNDLMLRNPFSKIKGLIVTSAETQRDRVLSFDEEIRLLEVCVDRRSHLRPLLICALDTAMRKGEMLRMTWDDVDFVNNEIFIPQTNTKTETSRTVGITTRLRAELIVLRERSADPDFGLVFGITDNVKRSWTTACCLAKVDDFRFHDCRHTATTRMIASGSPHMEVMKTTGHSQLKTFLRYLNLTSNSTNRIASRLSEYMLENQENIHHLSVGIN